MKANEFVKKFGMSQAKMFVDFYKDSADGFKYFKITPNQHQVHRGDREFDFEYDDLKRLVESWELVERFGGISKAVEYVDNFILPELSRAILDVESCQ